MFPYHTSPKFVRNVHTHVNSKQYKDPIYGNGFRTNKKTTIVFHNKLYTDAYKNNWTDALSVYLMLFDCFPNKRITIWRDSKKEFLESLCSEMGLCKNTLLSKIDILIKKKLIFKEWISDEIKNREADIYVLASNRKISERYNCKKFELFYDRNKYNKYKELKQFLRSIPLLSNLSKQKEEVVLHEHFSTLRKDIDEGYFVSHEDFHSLWRYEKKQAAKQKRSKFKNTVKGDLPNLSLKGIAKKINRSSSTTAFKYKKALMDKKILAQYKRTEVIGSAESKEHFDYMKRYQRSIPEHAILTRSNKICIYKSSLLFTVTDRWSAEKMDEYFNSNLSDYWSNETCSTNLITDSLKLAELMRLNHSQTEYYKQKYKSVYGYASLYLVDFYKECLDEGWSRIGLLYRTFCERTSIKHSGHKDDWNMPVLCKTFNVYIDGVLFLTT